MGIRDYTYYGLNQLKSVILMRHPELVEELIEDYSIPNITYDKNGNILNLVRKVNTSSFDDIDILTYTYNGNRLNKVEDAINGNHEIDFVNRNTGSDDYEYYANGALKKI